MGRSVFVNCPFDEEYLSLFRPLIFTILALGLKPRFALERSDSGESRINKITELISGSQFGIHDLSRCRAKKKGEYYRMNMPLELGLDMGAKAFGGGRYSNKKILILEEERYRFQKSISDLSNSDIKSHFGKPVEVVRAVRDWLVQEAQASAFSAGQIWDQFNYFMAENYDSLKMEGYSDEDIVKLPEYELYVLMERWLAEKPMQARVHDKGSV